MKRLRPSDHAQMQKRYRYWMGSVCCHPDCSSGYGIETHHIIPFKNGGPAEFWNFVTLCWRCHRKSKLHSSDKQIELFTWKCSRELAVYGFVLDEKESPLLHERLLQFKRDHPEMFTDNGGYDAGWETRKKALPKRVQGMRNALRHVEEPEALLHEQVPQQALQRLQDPELPEAPGGSGSRPEA